MGLGEVAIALDTNQCPECLAAMPNASHYAALQVIHDAIAILASWAETAFPPATDQTAIEGVQPFIKTAKEILHWLDREPAILRLVFDQIRLSDKPQVSENYRPAWALEVKSLQFDHVPIIFWVLLPVDWLACLLLLNEKTPRIPYPQTEEQAKAGIKALKGAIRKEITHLQPDNLAQLTLFLKKFGSHVSVGESNVALIDQARSTAALAAALAQNPPDEKLALIGGDLMGVQKFIYTIASDGALKSLRARSFYLEIATEEIVYRLLEKLELPHTNIIYAGASKFYILAPKTDQTCQKTQDLQNEFNEWLRTNFQKKVFLAMAIGETFPATDLSPKAPLEENTTRFAKHWQILNKKLADQALRKFDRNIADILEPQDSHEPCKVCRRDDTTDLDILNKDDPTSVEACPICRQMFALGGRLLKAKALLRTPHSQSSDIPEHHRKFEFQINSVFYQVVTDAVPQAESNHIFLINNWHLKNYTSDRIFPLLLGNYGQAGKEGFMSASEFAEESRGIKRVGYLRMDVDLLGQIFGRGLGKKHTLPRLVGLSRQMTYFFKVYLNSLAEYRIENLPQSIKILDSNNNRKKLLFIYAGGDDLFVSGSWNEVIEFAFDLYQSFRAYTGWHPDITLSAGICIEDAKFPLYQAAAFAGGLEDAAKDNQRDSLALFNQVFKWGQWLGEPSNYSEKVKLASESPKLFGILPFVEVLQDPNLSYPSSFIQNLLLTAQAQEKKAKAALPNSEKDYKQSDTYYFLHLPRLAYTLRDLPEKIPKDIREKIRSSLLSPHNSPYFRAIATWIDLLNRNQ